ncbi:uncharacterized protein LAJ45_02389 [Morchella importuna]|nr:uncharacterized protein LAJ45_02389 [Morchella importuna]KAH8153576.1 hypothetical protein LAJ45_02389 [Morchella importuna]
MTLDPTPPTTTFTKHPHYPYSPAASIASTASSSNSSVWSVATASSNATSIASSTTTDGLTAPNTAIITPLPTRSTWPKSSHPVARNQTSIKTSDGSQRHPHPPPVPTPAEIVPIEQRQNPRRTNRLVESVNATGCPVDGTCPLPPVPSLQRQADRKVNFVDNLVDSAAQIVETIWPPPRLGACAAASKDKVLPLRTFIQETLRRSRTSYSTLQVALYYLIVIRPHLPPRDCDINSMPLDEAQLIRAKQCGRRMFLAALILASKYLQDRNYSARAWSKISGLNTLEININEMAFLDAVNWKLHISETVFQKWTDLVLKYTSDHTPTSMSLLNASPWVDEEERKKEWCGLILTLTPDLTEVESPSGGLKHCSGDEVAMESFDRAMAAPQSSVQPSHRSSSLAQSSSLDTPAAGLVSGNGMAPPIATVVAGGAMAAMASVANVAHSNMISGSQENWSFITRRGPGAPPIVGACPSPRRKSSLSHMIKASSPAPGSPNGQFLRSTSICPLSSRKSPMFGSKRQNSEFKTGSPRLNEYRPCASPSSRDAAMSLNMLKEGSSPCSTGSTTPTSFPTLSRKRSYVASSLVSAAAEGHTSVTPKFSSLSGFASPATGMVASPNMDRSKRLRCAVAGGKLGIMEGIPVSQNVR